MRHDNGHFGWLLGGLVAFLASLFIVSGGTLGGKFVVQGDDDLPPVASVDQN